MSKGRWRRADWTQEQLNLVEALIAEGEETSKYVVWVHHQKEIGQSLEDIKSMAAKIRARRNEARQRAYHRILRARANGSEIDLPDIRPTKRNTRIAATMAPVARRSKDEDVLPPPAAPRDIAADHRVAQSTQKFLVDIELRARIAVQGVTAGLLGDPPAGRSALDKMRAGIVESTDNKQRNARSPLYVGDHRHLREEVRYLERALAR